MFRLPRFSVTRRCPSLLLRRPQQFLFCSSVLREEPDNFTVQTWLENANRFSQFKDSESFHKLLQDTLDHARSGNNEAQLALAFFYSGSPETFKEAKYWYEEAAKQSNPVALYALGVIFITGKTDGILNPYSRSDRIEKEKVSNLYYIDVDNLEEFLGPAVKLPEHNSENTEQFDYVNWLREEKLKNEKRKKSEKKKKRKTENPTRLV
eukprot:TRINITY_DN219_c0_g2_i3.p2 TRINITY_DN219_c0_g2~~TRINITY_DN219_c0_g2_i3.p2  ORF type:complete len:208 (-),score=42.75 TRINITY_DN219_c0_g2_i3:1930-2553(-)